MKRTIYLPDQLASMVARYLRAHPGATFSSLIQGALGQHLLPPRADKILTLAGLVKKGSGKAARRAEDETIGRER